MENAFSHSYVVFFLNYREAFHFSEEKRTLSASGISMSSSSSTSVQMRREFSAQLVTTLGDAPPLPPKKRHIKAYMEMVGPYSQPSEAELLRHTMEVYHAKAVQWHEHSEDLFQHNFVARASSYLTAPPVLPPKRSKRSVTAFPGGVGALIEAPSGDRRTHNESFSPPDTPSTPRPLHVPLLPLPAPTQPNGEGKPVNPEEDDEDGMEELDLSGELVLKQPDDEGPEVRGGSLDALITHAAKLNKADYVYQAAFLATYRTFITPEELTRKLIHRYKSIE